MENQNSMHLSVDLNTENGKAILAAVNAAVNGGVAKSASEPVKEKAAAPAPKAVAKPAAKMKVVEEAEEEVTDEVAEDEVEETPAPKAVAKPAPKAAPAAKAAAPAPKAVAKPAPKAAPAKAVAFEDLDEEGQLEALKAHATKHTKKGKTADIKALVANYGAERVSDLDPEYYVEFNEVLGRYSDGESVEDIFPNVD